MRSTPAAGEQSHVIELEEFVRAGEIDPVFYDRTYNVGVGDDGEDGYRLLHDALARADRVGIGRWTFHNREYLVAVRARDEVLALYTMRFAAELVDVKSLDVPARSNGCATTAPGASSTRSRTSTTPSTRPPPAGPLCTPCRDSRAPAAQAQPPEAMPLSPIARLPSLRSSTPRAANDQTVGSLAEILRHAGAVRAMELDINTYWTSFISYRHPGGSAAANLLADMDRSPLRYLTPDDRDFFAVYLR
jgi:Ku70/Ku80 beta-barrel domain